MSVEDGGVRGEREAEAMRVRRAIIYARAEHGYSVLAQLEACRKKVAEIGAAEVVEFVDEGVSGATLERPALTKARTLLRVGGVTEFVCYSPDRLARELSLLSRLTEEVGKAGARLLFAEPGATP